MRLFYSPTSPYVRKVMMTLHETGLLSQVELVAASGTPLNAGTAPVAQNPLGKVPTLERDDGPAVYDSRVICAYLDDRAQAGLYGTGAERFEVLTLEATADGMMDAALLMVYEGRLRPEELRMADWVEGQWLKVARALDALEDRWMAHLAGPYKMGHLTIAATLGYLDFRHDARKWRDGHPQLAAWFETQAARASFQATKPE